MKGEDGEVLLSLCGVAGAALDEAILAQRPYALAALYRGAPEGGRAGCARLPDPVRHVWARWLRRRRGCISRRILVAAARRAVASVEKVTLLVGAGTFLPVKAEDTASHVMHSEWGAIDAATAARLNAARAAGGRIFAVGTTSLRILECAADAAGQIRPFAGDTAIFITPGYKFRAVDALMTNFHLPRSTLFMLVCAFAGLERMQSAYAHAIAAATVFIPMATRACCFPRAEIGV